MIWLVGLALIRHCDGVRLHRVLLPWDQRAYWATTVGVEILDKTPLIGDFMARFLKGGPTPGQMTLSRFFVIHVMILPAALMGLAGLHFFLFRVAGRPVRSPVRPRRSRRRQTTSSPGRFGRTSSAWSFVCRDLCAGLLGAGRPVGRGRRLIRETTILNRNGIFSSTSNC
jgi:hypothetical protein